MDRDDGKLIEMIIEWGNSIDNGDYEIANRKYKSIIILIQKLNKYEPIEIIIDRLLISTEVSVKYWAFITALKNYVKVDIAERGLKELSSNTSIGPIGALAKIGVIEWYKQKGK